MIAVEEAVRRLLAGWLGKTLVASAAVLTSLRYGTGLYAWRVANQLERPSYEVLKTLPGGVEIRRYAPYLVAETTIDERQLLLSEDGNDDGGQRRRRRRRGRERNRFQTATSQGFRACASYIFGKNVPRETMAMTAPVRSSTSRRSTSDTTKKNNNNNNKGETMAMTAPVRSSMGTTSTSTSTSKSRSSSSTATMMPTKISFVVGSKYTLRTVPKPLAGSNVKVRQVPSHTLAVRSFAGPPPEDRRIRQERARVTQALEADGTYRVPTKKVKSLSLEENDTLVYGYHDPFITPNFLRRNEVAVVVEGTV